MYSKCPTPQDFKFVSPASLYLATFSVFKESTCVCQTLIAITPFSFALDRYCHLAECTGKAMHICHVATFRYIAVEFCLYV